MTVLQALGSSLRSSDTPATPPPDDARAAQAELVSVIIPAYNAAATIDETLISVRAQTYANLEILVVDDGSKDDTREIVARHAAQDQRVRLLPQANGGVARARNLGIARATGDFIAPVDADDLWRADKIAKQMQAMHEGGDQVGLVYTWFARIDENSVIFESEPPPEDGNGDVLQMLYRRNIIGNGSSPLMRRAVVEQVGGFEPALRDHGAQGCEDHLIYARIAERSHFAMVPEFLTGYRQTDDNMSSDTLQMLRSWTMVADELRNRRPEYARDLNIAECSLLYWLYSRSVRAFQPDRAWNVLKFMARTHPAMAAKHVLQTPGEIWIGLRDRRRKRAGHTVANRKGVKFLASPTP